MERKRILAVVAACVVLACQTLCAKQAASLEEKALDEQDAATLFRQVMNAFHEDRFNDAIATSVKIRTRYPQEPLGAFGLLTTYQTINRNYRIRLFDSKVDSLLDMAIELAEEALKRNDKSAHGYFCKGTAYGLRSLDRAYKKEWTAAFRDGTKVLDSFEKALRLDPEHYDSYFGMGMFNYWVGAKSKILRVFTKNRREEGMRQISLVATKGNFLKVDGQFSLTNVYYNEEDYETALSICDHLCKTYPTNPSLLYKRGRTLQKLQRWDEARRDFELLIDLLESTEYQSVSYQIDGLYQLAKCNYELGHYLDAKRYCDLAVQLEKKCDISREREGLLESYADLIKQLHELHNEIKGLPVSPVHTAGSQ